MSLETYLQKNLGMNIETRPKDWAILALNIKERDGNKCRLCKSEENLVVHHVVPLIEGGSNDESNLITVCKKCHYALDPRGNQTRAAGRLRYPFSRKLSIIEKIAENSRHPLLDLIRELKVTPNTAISYLRFLKGRFYDPFSYFCEGYPDFTSLPAVFGVGGSQRPGGEG